MIEVRHRGDFDKLEGFFKVVKQRKIYHRLNHYGELGVNALAANTPVDTGKTAASWKYRVRMSGDEISITWTNDNLTKTGIPIAILLQYGHGTRNGGYVQGRDYINPAIRPIFDEIAKNVWEEVTKS